MKNSATMARERRAFYRQKRVVISAKLSRAFAKELETYGDRAADFGYQELVQIAQQKGATDQQADVLARDYGREP